MFNNIKKAGRSIKRFQNRAILGIIIMATGIGVGGGLIISTYAPILKGEKNS